MHPSLPILYSFGEAGAPAGPELELKKGDLVVRHRGYLLYDEMQRHLGAESDCIYRHKSRNTYWNPQRVRDTH